MGTPDVNFNLADSYFTLLKNLSPNNKLEFIGQLSKSMKTTKIKKDTSWEALSDDREPDQSAEDFVEQLKMHTHPNAVR